MAEMSETTRAAMDATAWPESVEGATADALIVHAARLAISASAKADLLMSDAFRYAAGDEAGKPARRRWMDALTREVSLAQVAVLLVGVQASAPDVAASVARRLWELTDDGGVLHELMWEYLEARGVDPEVVFTAAKESARERAEAELYEDRYPSKHEAGRIETWPMDCVEGDCEHRPAEGEPDAGPLETCPSTMRMVCLDCSAVNGDDEGPVVVWPCENMALQQWQAAGGPERRKDAMSEAFLRGWAEHIRWSEAAVPEATEGGA